MTDPDRSPATDIPEGAGTLYALLSAWAAHQPDAPAILAPGRKPLGFGALLQQLDEFRKTLNECGLGRGDRIALLTPRGPETAVAALAISCCSTCVPVNPGATAAEITATLRETRARALLIPTARDAATLELARQSGVPLIQGSSLPGAAAGQLHIQCEQISASGRPGTAMAGDEALVMRTSGTTARARIVPIHHHHILARIDKTRRLLRLVPGDRCLNLMPLCYVHGLHSGLMGPLGAGGSAICPTGFDRETFFDCIRNLEPSWYTAGATYQQAILEWLLQDPEAITPNRLRFARSGSSPLPGKVQTQLEDLLGIPVIESYSATEAGTMTANPPDAQRKPGSVGVMLDDDIAIADEQGQRLATGMTGEVLVRGPGVITRYENNPEADQQAFRDGWFRTGDLGQLDADGYLTLCGRIKDIINRGGEKVSPAEVDAVLLEHPAVVQAVTFALPHPTMHEEVAAAVVLQQDSPVTERVLRQFLYQRLAPFKVPRRIVITAELPRGPSGKLLRHELSGHYSTTLETSPAAADSANYNPVEQRLVTLWCEVLKRASIGPEDDFFLLGGDSLSAIKLLVRIEQEFQVKLPLQHMLEMATVPQMAQFIQAYRNGNAKDLVDINTSGTQRPLFVVGGRSGYVLRLLQVGRELGADQPLYGMQPPGMDWEQAGCETLSEMAAYYIKQIKSVQTRGPYRLLGVSFGGLVLFEAALQLQRAGETVDFLGLVDTLAPTCRRGTHIDVGKPIESGNATQGDSNAIQAAARRTGAIHVRARQSYLLEHAFEGEITYFYCEGVAITPRLDRRRLWRHFSSGGIRMLPLPGQHGDILNEPQFSVFCKSLRTCLAGQRPPSADIVSIFGQNHRLLHEQGGETIQDRTDKTVYPVAARRRGLLKTAVINRWGLHLRGWATNQACNQPAARLLIFLNGRYAGCCKCGCLLENLANAHADPGLRYAGFDLVLTLPAHLKERALNLRVFALSDDAAATELNYSQELFTTTSLQETSD